MSGAPKLNAENSPVIEITPEMIEAGVSVLADRYGVVSEWAAEELAREVFSAMSERINTCAHAEKTTDCAGNPDGGADEEGA